jgi:hypothetical protein
MEKLLNKPRANETHAVLGVLTVLLMKIQDLWP